MLRNARHDKILEIISEKEIETQEELCKELAACNYTVTQATVSRDIKELRLFKVKGTKKRFRYTCVGESSNELPDKMRAMFTTCVQSIRQVGNLIVLLTLLGNGTNAGVIVDELHYPEVIGTVSGDNTVLVICENEEEARVVCSKLELLIKE